MTKFTNVIVRRPAKSMVEGDVYKRQPYANSGVDR